MLTVRTSENTVITSFRLITERQDFSSVRTAENTVRARARIHASKEFKKEGPRNFLLDEHLNKIFDAYKERKSIEKFSYLASLEEIQAQGFNLNIPRYVDTSEEEEEINLEGVFTELLSLETEEKQLKSELNEYFQQLGLNYEI